ncbi:general secretion pathway protein GspE [Stigmatella erecta]|uniref:Type II secretion system (T2SS), protein E, N-terminal domain n=1 Tax=Stigmatella erecta TaxID=83460 RepID=A0A1I0LD29_9BACT|nr:general secretion pathway protein GspE [Stigmatella erecta]SEU37517.1 Type II secretion system (T2SS), protein E, N-terminal domain [Stigmatella erecta]
MERKRIGEILLQRGAISPVQLEEGLKAQRQTQQRLGATLVAQGAITEATLVQALSEALGLPVVELAAVTPDWAAIHLVRARFCEQHELFPFALENRGGRRHLVVAMTDPLHGPALEEIEFTTGLKVSPRVAARSAVLAAILRYYHKAAPAPARPGAPTGKQAPRAAQARPPLPSRPAQAPVGREDDDEEVIVGEELSAADKTQRTRLADLITEREQQRRKKGAKAPARPAPGGSGVLDDLDYLIGGGGLRDEPDRIEELERKFWALMRIMARKGLLTNEEFTRELDDKGES